MKIFATLWDLISSGLGFIFRFGIVSYILIGLMILAGLVAVVWFLQVHRKSKQQWTHTIRVKRLLQNGTLTKEQIHKARRFPLEKGVEMFEVDKPILGSFLIPQPGEYTGLNEFSIVLDSNNRIYLNKGEKFDKDKQSVNVSVVHAGIDVEMANMKEKWQQAHRVDKRLTTAELIKAGLKALMFICITIMVIMALKEWGTAQQYHAESDRAQAEAMKQINEATKTMQAVVNTQQLQIIPMLKALYQTDNIAEVINQYQEDEN